MIQFTLQYFGIHTIVGTHVINTGTETASTKMFPLRTFDPVACHRTSALRSSNPLLDETLATQIYNNRASNQQNVAESKTQKQNQKRKFVHRF